MTPTEYLNIVVLPTTKEFMSSTGDRRLAYHSCQSAFHLCDYIFRADAKPLKDVRAAIRANCQWPYEVIEGIANGSKHCGREKGRGDYQHEPGTEREAPPFTCGESELGRDRLSIPGLEISHDGKDAFVDECLRTFLLGAQKAFPTHFGGTDWAWLRDV